MSKAYAATRDKPRSRKVVNFAFVFNIVSACLVVPLFYLLERSWIKSVRISAVMCTFSLLTDTYI